MKRRDELKRLDKLLSLEEDRHPEKVGVLLSDEIIFYVGECGLIEPFWHEHLKPAHTN